MAEVGSAYVSLVPSARGFGKATEKQIGGEVDAAGKSSGKKFGMGLKVGALAVIGGGLALGKFLSGTLDEAREAQRVGALTNAVIKSTGGVANVTAKDVDSLATSLSNKIGVDDEAIAAGQNMLLTFTKVRNEVGKGNQIFNRATVVASDMAAAFGGDAVSNSKMLGKALNDPTKGVSALTRVGVSFTQQQKDQIKSMQESGDLLGAQKIILGEVGKQTKGAAESQVTNADKVAVAWGNVKEQIGAQLLPVVEKMLGAFLKAMPTISRLVAGVGPAFGKVMEFLQPVVVFVMGFFKSLNSGEGGGQLKQLQATFTSVFNNIKAIVRDAVTIVRVLWQAFGATIIRYTKAAFSNALLVIRGAFQIIAGIFKVFSSLLKGDWRGVWEGIKQILRGAWNIIKGLVRQGWNLLATAFSVGGTVIKGIFSRAWDGVKTLARKGVDEVVAAVKAMPGKIKGVGGDMLAAGKAIIGKLVDGLSQAGGVAGSIAAGVGSAVKGAINSLISSLNNAIPNSLGAGKIKVSIPANPIPMLAEGGILTGPTLNIAGEAGPEAVVPLARLSSMLDRERAAGAASAGASGPATFNLYDVNGVLLGAIRGEARREIGAASGMAGQRTRARASA